MNTKSMIYFGSGLVCLIVALFIFYTEFFTLIGFLFLIIGVASVLLFRQGLAEMKKRKEKNQL
jgi:membrane protein implicated in regulation of membrane protease activity